MTIVWVLIQTTLLLLSSHSSANDLFVEMYGDSQELSLIQKNGQNNDAELYITGDENIAIIVQDGSSNYINLTQSGDYSTTTSINQTGDNKGLTIDNYCTNPSGCSISVTQN